MKLFLHISTRVCIALFLLFSIWGSIFYYVIIGEIIDEMDDSLENYSEMIIMRKMAGEELPQSDNGSNNYYYIRDISQLAYESQPHIVYADTLIYIEEREETDPARILTTLFKDGEGGYFELNVATPSIERDDLQRSILVWIIVLYLTMVVLITGMNLWIIYNSMKPLYRFLHWLDQFTLGKQNRPLTTNTSVTEFRRLYDSANRNTARMEQMYQLQKLFIGNAAHELQTPLAVAQNRLMLLMENGNLNEEQMVEIGRTCETLQQMTRLNKTLLLLSKIENGQQFELSTIVINNIIEELCDTFDEIYATKEITLSIEADSLIRVTMNESLCRSLLVNFIKNSYVHNVHNGQIIIILNSSYLRISNSGKQQALRSDKIFQPFYKENTSERSTGLGLALCQAICKMYNYQLEYSYEQGIHSFTVVWKEPLLL